MSKDAIQSTPPIVVSGLTLAGIPLQEWVYILTLVYLIFQIGFVLRKVYYTYKGDRREDKRRGDEKSSSGKILS